MHKDPRRPDLPYSEGLELTIRPHNPPLPFTNNAGSSRDKNVRPECFDGKEMSNFTQSEWCLTHPLIETSPHESYNSTRKLRVTNKIAVRDGHGAQIVRCCLDEDEAHQYVAKIYDPLYYPFHENNGIYAFLDSPWKADDDYSREALAYQKLVEFGLDGEFTPKFYGCWTFNIPFLGEPVVNRPVRLILMEYLPGVSMYWIEKEKKINKITPQNRLNIYAKVLEADTTLEFYGITHNDVSPRNVLLVGPYEGDNLPQIYLIDFNCADIGVPLNSESREAKERLVKPVSPRYHHWGHLNTEFLVWVPDPLTETIHFKGWLKKVWGDDENERFGGPSPLMEKDFGYNDEAEYVEPIDQPAKQY